MTDQNDVQLTPKQEQEFRCYFRYRKPYVAKWLRVAKQNNFETVEAMLIEFYKTRSVFQIGDLLGFTGMQVWYVMERMQIPRRTPEYKNPATHFGRGRPQPQ